MARLRWNDNQDRWQGFSDDTFVSLPDEKMRELIEQDLARYGDNPTEEERIAATHRWMSVDRYATPIPGVEVTHAGRSDSIEPRSRRVRE